ncbi:FecR domain-containing protein [Mucilaginibacter sabulilitoris]|uniref:FecR domain-containing protein n=1 Tax=Mucilaginibacter sabulilitoris TaxID=1173583 RepID=A0ABZ0TMF1_9SPHI|nr:FecR domain-containing protein [Mucilaginibacter sabulilitoris]WPU94346.1 FecR domain-containing protein [Mucilaginibacter sabulilitoris]
MRKTERDFYIAELISKLLKGDISPEEDLWLKNWVEESAVNRAHFEKLTDQSYLENRLKYWNAIDKEKAWDKLQQKLEAKETKARFNYLPLLKYAAILILLSTVGILLYRENSKHLQKAVNQSIVHNQIRPGSNHAILILGNGEKITLKKHAKLSISENDGTAVSSQNDVLAYKQDERQSGVDQKLVYNTIMVPRGGVYQLILADGSKVWMNSASSLRYPTAFSGKDRRVYLTGEAYFEVAKNARMPFIVKTNKAEVQVLGTHFNVMAYDDESSCKTTLLEGAVKVQSSAAVNVIKPGQQAVIDIQGQQKINSDIDVDEELAWKNGLFIFKDAGIKGIMQQASRWYDVDVVYEGKIPEIQFTGQMSRKVDFYGFTNILKYAGLNFNIKGKTVTITK